MEKNKSNNNNINISNNNENNKSNNNENNLNKNNNSNISNNNESNLNKNNNSILSNNNESNINKNNNSNINNKSLEKSLNANNNSNNEPKSCLVIKVTNVEFAKDFNYFITTQLLPESIKRRTEVSSCISTPVFKNNTFIFPLNKYFLQEENLLKIKGYIVVDKENISNWDNEPKGNVRVLGECIINWNNFKHLLTDISETGVNESIKLLKSNKDQNKITVGRMLVNMKLVGEDVIPNETFNQSKEKIEEYKENSDIIRPLPKTDLDMKFNWRLRVDIRCAIDLILDRTDIGAPSIQVELGLTDENDEKPESFRRHLTKIIENDRSPIFNQQFLLNSQSDLKTNLYIIIINRNNELVIDELFIPINRFKSFYPYNFEFKSSKKEYKAPGYIYISCIWEEFKENDELIDIVVNDIDFDPPLNENLNRMMIALSKDDYNPEKIINFINIDLFDKESITNKIEEENNLNNPIFYSPLMKLPLTKLENYYNALCLFCLPKSMIQTKLCFFICFRNKENKEILHTLSNDKTGRTDYIDDIIIEQLENNENSLIPIKWLEISEFYNLTSKSLNSKINFSSHKLIFNKNLSSFNKSQSILKDKTIEESKININEENYINIMKQNLKSILTINNEKDKWNLLSKELSQKQEITHRLLKDYDEKSENLRVLGEEINDLRKQLKVIINENNSLKKKLNIEEKIEIQKFITKEVAEMSGEELKIRLIRAAQLYRDEKNRNEEFEIALHKAHRDLLKVKELEKEYEKLQDVHKNRANKLLTMQEQLNKANLYKKTILDQEKVISKLERLLEISIKNSDISQKKKLDWEKILTENIKLELEIKNSIKGSGNVDDLIKLKKDVQVLEKIRNNLKNDLFNKRPISSKRQEIEKEKVELDLNIERLENKELILREQLENDNKKNLKEILYLEQILKEKEEQLNVIIN